MTTRIFEIKENFDITAFADRLSQIYRQKGYNSAWVTLGSGICVDISKNTDGINQVIGLCEGIKVNMLKDNNKLIVNFTDEAWTDKIIAFAIGCVTCGIIWIPAAIGGYRQYQLTNHIVIDVQMNLNFSG